MIKNLIKNKNITEQSQIDFIERCGDLFYFNNKFILDYIKYKLNEIINKRKKSKKINYEQIKIIDKVKLQITKEQISSLEESYNISIEIYKEIAEIERKRVENNLSFIFYNVIRFLPVTSKRLILEDLEKIIKNKFKRLSKNKNSNENNIEEYLDYLQSKYSEKEFNKYIK